MRRRVLLRGGLAWPLVISLLLSGCAGYAERVADGLARYEAGDPEGARDRFRALPPGVDLHLARLESAMADLASGDPAAAAADFGVALRHMEALRESLVRRELASFVLDDTVRIYPGAPYEQICARVFLALAYLLLPGRLEDALAACRDLDIKMEQIEALYERSYHFDAEGRPSDFSFQIPPLGKYIAALAAERRGEMDSALLFLEQARRGLPQSRFLAREESRMRSGKRERLVFVFSLLGMVPRKREGTSEELTWLLRGIKAMYAILRPRESPAALASIYWTAPVKMPEYPPETPFWHGGLEIRGGSRGAVAMSESLADFDAYARREHREILPGILIRAAVRRILKESGGKWLSHEISEDDEMRALLESVFSSLTSALETVDTRGWYTLPRELHAAVIELDPGAGAIVLTPRGRYGQRIGEDLRVQIDGSGASPAYVLVVHPSEATAPIAVVDEEHRPREMP